MTTPVKKATTWPLDKDYGIMMGVWLVSTAALTAIGLLILTVAAFVWQWQHTWLDANWPTVRQGLFYLSFACLVIALVPKTGISQNLTVNKETGWAGVFLIAALRHGDWSAGINVTALIGVALLYLYKKRLSDNWRKNLYVGLFVAIIATAIFSFFVEFKLLPTSFSLEAIRLSIVGMGH